MRECQYADCSGFLIEGRSDDVKKTLIEKITAAIVDSGCGPREAIRILIQELPSNHWGIAGKTAKELGR